MRSIFEPDTLEELLKRIDALDEKAQRQWGKMSLGQMLWHCQFPLALGIENKISKKKPNLLVQWFFKKSMYNDKPWRKNLPTSPKIKAREPKAFTEELPKLRKLVEDFHQLKTRENWNSHPLFGELSKAQWGMMQYKHLDHHLKQFGV
ncbi:MAG: DUF1569 domain-containing protein [Flavobacteriaceae bacterium]